MKEIEMVYCGNILEEYSIEAALKDYTDHRPVKVQDVGPYFKEHDIGAQRANCGFPSLDISKGIQSRDESIEGVDVRIYTPSNTSNNLPCIAFIHGGGFVAGNLDSVDHACRRLAELADSCVVSIDYGLSPEHACPTAIKECLNVLYHLYEYADTYQINKKEIALSGDSAGGNIALSVAQMDAKDKSVITYLMLYYPVVDQSDSVVHEKVKTNSYIEAYFASLASSSVLFQDCYLQGHDAKDPLVSPLFLSTLKGLPPMVLCIAEYDYLNPSQVAFFEKFKETHDIELLCYRGVNHGFLDKIGVFPQADDSLHRLANRWNQRRFNHGK